MQLSDYILQVQQAVHDTSAIDYSTSDLTQFINQARSRTAQDFWCCRNLFRGASLVVGQVGVFDQFGNQIGESYPMNNAVAGGVITNGGGTYSAPPSVTFSAPPAGGTQATGVAIMSGTAPTQSVQQIGMTQWGMGYTSAPTITFGSGSAAATATWLGNVFDIYTITYLFGVQAPTLGWAPFGAFQAYFRSYRAQSGAPGVWSGYNDQNRFFIWPGVPDQNYPLELDTFVLPFPLVNVTDVDNQIYGPIQDCVQFYAAHLAIQKTQNFEQASYFLKRYNDRAKEVGASRLAPRRPNIYNNLWRRVQRGYA